MTYNAITTLRSPLGSHGITTAIIHAGTYERCATVNLKLGRLPGMDSFESNTLFLKPTVQAFNRLLNSIT